MRSPLVAAAAVLCLTVPCAAAASGAGASADPAPARSAVTARHHDRPAVREREALAPTSGSASPDVQHAYVAQLTGPSRSYPLSTSTMLRQIGQTLTRWRGEADGAITSFTIAASATFTTDDDCTSTSTMWADAQRLWPDVDFGDATGDHLIVVVPPSCGGSVGTVNSNGLRSGGKVLLDPDTTRARTP